MTNTNDEPIEEVVVEHYYPRSWPKDLNDVVPVRSVKPAPVQQPEKPKEPENGSKKPILAFGQDNFVIDVKRGCVKPAGIIQNNLGYLETSLPKAIKDYEEYLVKKGKKTDKVLEDAKKALEKNLKSKEKFGQSLTRIFNTPIGGK